MTCTPEQAQRRALRPQTGPGFVQRRRPLCEPQLQVPGSCTRATEDTATLSSCARTTLLVLSACSRSSRSLFCSSDSNSSSSSWGRKAQGDEDSGGPAETDRAPPRQEREHEGGPQARAGPASARPAPQCPQAAPTEDEVCHFPCRPITFCSHTGASGPTGREPESRQRPT